MSKRRRDRGDTPDDILDDLKTNTLSTPVPIAPQVTASEIADQAYGSNVGVDDPFAKIGRDRIKVTPKSIFSIYPDLAQPRRVIPSGVRQYWNGQPDEEAMAYLFDMWLKEVTLERGGKRIAIDEILHGEPNERSLAGESDQLGRIGTEDSSGPLESALLKVVELAASIKRDGLTNPITIVPKDSFFTIETGERRWLAYHLLNWRIGTDSTDWQKIPARIVDELSIWRQATENNARADLNAISKARQFALLLMDLYRAQGGRFKAIHEFKHEQDFYAQVADGNEWTIPRNNGEMLLNAMGLKNSVQLRQYRALLRIPKSLWMEADDRNLTEGEIRKVIQQGDTVTRVTPDTPPIELFTGSIIPKLKKQWRKLSKREKQDAIEEVRALLEELENDL